MTQPDLFDRVSIAEATRIADKMVAELVDRIPPITRAGFSIVPPTPEEIARAEADSGMRRALEHANADCPKWSDIALLFLAKFARTHKTFISEDVSDASKAWGMVQPGTDRAWGAVYRLAIKRGIIVQDGSGRSRRRHASICPRWRSLVCG